MAPPPELSKQPGDRRWGLWLDEYGSLIQMICLRPFTPIALLWANVNVCPSGAQRSFVKMICMPVGLFPYSPRHRRGNGDVGSGSQIGDGS